MSHSVLPFLGLANMNLGGYRSGGGGIWRKAKFSRSSPTVANLSLQNPATIRAASVATQQRKRAIKTNKVMPSNKDNVKTNEYALGAKIDRRMSNP